MVPQHMHVSLTNHSMQRWLFVAVTCVAVFSVTTSARGTPRTDRERVAYWAARLGDDSASVRAFAAVMLGQLANSEMDPSLLIETLRTDPDVHVRTNAAAAMGSIGGKTLHRCVGVLVLALKDADGDVRAHAAMALAQVDPSVPTDHLDELIAALGDATVQVSVHCATALAKIGSPSIDHLAAALADRDRKAGAASALSQMRDEIPPRHLPALVSRLDDDDARVRSGCAEVLGRMGAPAAEGLVRILASGRQDARIAAVIALVQIDATLLIPYIVELIEALDDESIQVRGPCAEMLGEMGSAAEERLIHTLRQGTGNARVGAARALAQIDPNVSGAYVTNLVDGLGDDLMLVRVSCRRALAKVGVTAAPDLMNALESSDTKNGLEVLDSLIEISPGPPAIISVLLESLQDEDTNVRLRAVSVLRDVDSNSMGITTAIGDVLKNDSVVAVRLVSLSALAVVAPANVTAKALRAVLENDPDSRVRARALRALVRLGPDVDGRSSTLIRALTDDPADGVRLGVMDSMIEFGIPDPRDAVPAIIERLEDDERDVRMRAMDVIQAIETVDDSVPILAYAMTTRYHDVRRRAGSVLVEIGAAANKSMRQLVETLAQALTSDRDYVVRSLAARALGNLGPAAATAAASLATASKDPAPGVSTNAIRALRIISAH